MELNEKLPTEICLYIERILSRDRLWHCRKFLEKAFVRENINKQFTGIEDYYRTVDNKLFITHYHVGNHWWTNVEMAATEENLKKCCFTTVRIEHYPLGIGLEFLNL